MAFRWESIKNHREDIKRFGGGGRGGAGGRETLRNCVQGGRTHGGLGGDSQQSLIS